MWSQSICEPNAALPPGKPFCQGPAAPNTRDQRAGRSLKPGEVCLLKILHAAVNPDLTEERIKAIADRTELITQKDLNSLGRKYVLAKRIMSISLAGDAAAITLPRGLTGGTILIASKEPFDPFDGFRVKDVKQLALLAHELQHAVQTTIIGEGWIVKYLDEYIYNRADEGMSAEKAYRCIPAEIEAYAVQDALQSVLRDQTSVKEFEEACRLVEAKSKLAKFHTLNLQIRFKEAFVKARDQLTAQCKPKR